MLRHIDPLFGLRICAHILSHIEGCAESPSICYHTVSICAHILLHIEGGAEPPSETPY